MSTDQELKEKEQTEPRDEGYSEMQFSAHMTAEFTENNLADEPDSTPADIMEQAEREQEEMTRRDREILAALDEVLQKNSVPLRQAPPKKKKPDIRQFVVGTIRYGAGVVSLALTLILMGVTLMCLLFSGTPDLTLLIKLSPIAAVILGVEIILSWLASGRKVRVNIPCVCADVVVVVGCCILAAALSNRITETEQQFSNRSAEAYIYDASYSSLKHAADISTLTVDVDLNLEGGVKRTDSELTTADDISIDVVLGGGYSSPSEFAAECGSVIRVFSDLGIPVDDFQFTAETRLMSFAMKVDGRYQQELTDEQLTELVRYVLIEDYDYIQDLSDFTEETGEASTEE